MFIQTLLGDYTKNIRSGVQTESVFYLFTVFIFSEHLSLSYSSSHLHFVLHINRKQNYYEVKNVHHHVNVLSLGNKEWPRIFNKLFAMFAIMLAFALLTLVLCDLVAI